jgi:outer membrane murein-binding lipoprotein Lpp
MRRQTFQIFRPVALVAAVLLAGCNGPTTAERFRQLDQQVRDLNDQVDKLAKEGAAKDAMIEAQRKQITTLQHLGEKRLDRLPHVERIELDRLTGGANYDGKPGDDGVTVYLQPIDQDGHVIKAAGEIRIQLFDLANPDGRRLIGEYRLDVDHTREAWQGRLMTYHYTVKCPWRAGPPAHDEITVRVEFLDYLTGKTFRTQKLVKVRLK